MAVLTNNRSLILLLLGLYQLNLVAAQQCSPVEGQPTCVCDTGGAGIVNLTSIASTDTSSPAFVKMEGPGKYMYSYNPCFGFSDAGSDDCKDVAGCQYNGDSSVSIGTITTETFQYSATSAGSQLLTVRYSQGTGDRETIVWLICDQSADSPTFEALGEKEQRLTYEFNLTTKCACPGVCTAAAGPAPSEYEPPVGYIGLVLIIVSIAAFVTYFIVGAIVSKFKMNKSGLDLIPNKLFWKDLPFLLKDGLLFVVKFFLYVGNLIRGRFTNRKYSII